MRRKLYMLIIIITVITGMMGFTGVLGSPATQDHNLLMNPGDNPSFHAYNVTFFEHGLPLNTTWCISAPSPQNRGGVHSYNTIANTSECNQITDFLSNGTYFFSVQYFIVGNIEFVPDHSRITVIVSGGNMSDTLTYSSFKLPPPPKGYTLSMNMVNLPAVMNGIDFSWTATVRHMSTGLSSSCVSYNSTMQFSSAFVNGTYSYTIFTSSSSFEISPSSGFFQVNGKNVTLSFSYEHIAIKKMYKVTFSESGLPTGDIFIEKLYESPSHHDELQSNSTFVTGQSQVTFLLRNGTYCFQSSYFEGSNSAVYSSNNSYGSLIVNGTSVRVNVSYTEEHMITFKINSVPESSLLEYHICLVSAKDGATRSRQSTYTSVSFCVPSGTYFYKIIVDTGNYKLTPSFGEVRTAGQNETIIINATYENGYTLMVIEHGIPLQSSLGYTWMVDLSGSHISLSEVSSSSIIVFHVPNGTYSVSYYLYDQVGSRTELATQYHSTSSAVTIAGKSAVINATYSPGSVSSSLSMSTIGVPIIVGIMAVLAGAGIAVLIMRRK